MVKAAPKSEKPPKKPKQADTGDVSVYAKEYWTGDSRDGALVNGDGYHFYRMIEGGLIKEAFEYYETDDGLEVVSPLPEMLGVHWVKDLGFDENEALEVITAGEFERVKELAGG